MKKPKTFDDLCSMDEAQLKAIIKKYNINFEWDKWANPYYKSRLAIAEYLNIEIPKHVYV